MRNKTPQIPDMATIENMRDDSSALYRTLKDLQPLAEALFLIFEYSVNGIYLVDGNGINRYFNRSYEALTGLKRTELIGHPSHQLVESGKVDYSVAEISLQEKRKITQDLFFPLTGKLITISTNLVFNEDGSIYAVIGLPAGIFFSTGIPTCVIILKKDNTDRSVLFIDASKEFRKDKAQNYMDPEHINKIVEAYKNRQDIDKFAHLATFEEIKENDYNLNIPRYVDTSEPEPEIDLDAVTANMESIDADIKNASSELLGMMKDLTFSNPEIEQSMSKLIKTLEV